MKKSAPRRLCTQMTSLTSPLCLKEISSVYYSMNFPIPSVLSISLPPLCLHACVHTHVYEKHNECVKYARVRVIGQVIKISSIEN